MRTLTIFCLFILNYFISFSQTTVGGNISTNTTWTISGSPYIVTSNLIVDTSAILTIEPGVTIKIDRNKNIAIKGTLIAIGKSDSLITFTANSATPFIGYWEFIAFDYGSISYDLATMSGSIFKYCTIEYGGGGAYNGIGLYHVIQLFSSSPYFENCNIQHNRGIFGTLTQDTINYYFKNNRFIDNRTPLPNNCIDYNGSFSNSDTLFLTCNAFINNNSSYGGPSNLISQFGGCTIIERNIFTENLALDYDWIFLRSNSIFNYNQIVNNDLDARGIRAAGTIQYNTIYGNGLDEFSNRPTIIQLGDTSINLKYNNIFKNDFSSISVTPQYQYAISTFLNNFSSFNYDVTNNYWGTSNTYIIDSIIFDSLDFSTYPTAVYSPFLSNPDINAPISPVSNVQKTDLGGGNIKVDWDANLEQDLLGYKIYWGNPTGYSYSNSIDVGNVTSYILTGVSINDEIAVTAYDSSYVNSSSTCNCNESWFQSARLNSSTDISTINTSLGIIFYPNPANDILQIQFPKSIENLHLNIYNQLGQNVKSIKLSSDKVQQISVADLNTGIYLLNVSDGTININSKFIKK